MRFPFLLYISIGFVIFSCSKEEPKKSETNSSFQQVYEMSDMALLMEKMYADLEKNRNPVLEGQAVSEFPVEFNKIHTAEMTPSFQRTDEFNRLADLYLQNLQNLHKADKENPNRKELYNNVVKSCITCHRSDAGCIGPVDRIGKLLIE